MKLRGLVVTAVVACAVGWVGRSVFSDDPPMNPPAEDPMKAWAEFGKPGEEQARLKAFVGEWAVHVKMTGEAGKEEEMDGTSTFTMVMGDRYLRQVAIGSFGGAPFEGNAIFAYDKGAKKWVSSWIDSMGTGIMAGEGEETVKGKSWTFKSSFVGPTGPTATKDVYTFVSDKEISHESFMGGSDKPMMTLNYKRK